MKSMIIVALALVAIAVAYPVEEGLALTKAYKFEQQPDGSYILEFETENGIIRREEGVLKTVYDEENKPQTVLVVSGTNSYLKSDGTVETIAYSADETGYHAEGPSVPKDVSL